MVIYLLKGFSLILRFEWDFDFGGVLIFLKVSLDFCKGGDSESKKARCKSLKAHEKIKKSSQKSWAAKIKNATVIEKATHILKKCHKNDKNKWSAKAKSLSLILKNCKHKKHLQFKSTSIFKNNRFNLKKPRTLFLTTAPP